MAAFLITCVIIQAVLLWVIECRPLKNGPMYKAGSTGGGSYKAPGVYQSEVVVNPGYGGTSSQSGHGYQDGSAMAPPPGYNPDSTHGASQDGSWVISPITFSGGHGGSSTSNGSPSALPPPPESFPGELLQVEATNEKGAYESETQEKGTPPWAASAPPLPASAPQQGASMPSAFSRGSSFPFNMRFLRGQYLTGTYTDYTSSLENGRDDSQENHYIVYDSPSSSEQQQQWEEEQQQQQQQQREEEEQWEGQQQEWDSVQPVWQQQQGQTRASPQSVLMASLGMPSGYGQQATRYYQ
ncbi:ras-interacting protein RIP3-like [Gadus chalcogrammus]|uniref:ras-interacting protein RIP3-like n=1 Tax=Gadus chalcogrammus TaxID=1042646 RepID=UPI0024C483C3|nr:ras-interacting protein RIP3-like [Gadus chalcogrammus]